MTKLITAEEAREMRDMSLIHFVNNDMEKYIVHINKLVKEATSKGEYGFVVALYSHPDYPERVDKVLSELSEVKRKVLFEHLKENGYRPVIYTNAFYLYWDDAKEKPEVKETPKKKSLWDIWGNWYV